LDLSQVGFSSHDMGLLLRSMVETIDAKDMKTLGYCRAMWYFGTVPSPLLPDTVSIDGAGVDSGGTGTSAAHCWNCSSSGSYEQSLCLATIALVLDWREEFETQIKTVIWDWKSSQADTATPIEYLQMGGDNGLDSMSSK
jgi:hypothetical protein